MPSSKQRAETVAQGLQSSGIPKDRLVKLLKEAGDLLEQADQDDSGHAIAVQLYPPLLQKSYLRHRDTDVQATAAFCWSNILRLMAGEEAELPFSTKEQQEIFGTFVWAFRQLQDANNPCFKRSLQILVIVAQTKCCVLMLDWEDTSMVCEITEVLLEALSASNQDHVAPHAQEVLVSILEGGDLPGQLLDNLLIYLVPPDSKDHPEACRLVGQVLRKVERQLQAQLQHLLVALLTGPSNGSPLRANLAPLILQIQEACPRMLLPVLPQLDTQLHGDADQARLKAVRLVGKLFSHPRGDLAQQYPELLAGLMLRLKDTQVDIRLEAVKLAGDVLAYQDDPYIRATARLALLDRFLDAQEKVRCAAIASICRAGVACLEAMTVECLMAVAVRLHDKKVTVCKEAASGMLSIFRTYCPRLAEEIGERTAMDDLILRLPGRVLAEAREVELAQYVLDTLLKGGLFPGPFQAQEPAARLWVLLWRVSSAEERQAYVQRVALRAKLQAAVQAFTAERNQAQEDSNGSSAATLRRVAAHFSNDSKAAEQLSKLAEHKDNNVFKDLASLSAPLVDRTGAANLSKSICQRLGTKGALGDFARSLCTMLAPSLVAPSHVVGLTRIARSQDGAAAAAAQDLLLLLAPAAPGLVAASADQVLEMISDEDPALGAFSVQILSKVGAHLPEAVCKAPAKLQAAVPHLFEVAESGPPKASKAAVRALVAVLKPDEAAAKLEDLCVSALYSLKQSTTPLDKMSAGVQAISTVGQLLPAVFQQFCQAFTDFVLKKLLPAKPSTQAKRQKGPSQAAQLKAHAMKALGRALAPALTRGNEPLPEAVQAAAAQALADFCDLSEKDLIAELGHSSQDESILRSAASTAALRLARRHDKALPAETYLRLALAMQDAHAAVRQKFGQKVARCVEVFCRPAWGNVRAGKYAAMLPLAAMDPLHESQQAAFAALRRYAGLCHTTAQRRLATAGLAASAAAGASTVQQFPEILVPFLLQILAHHADFPTAEELAAEGPVLLEPFQTMLQFAFEGLLGPLPACKQPAGATLPALMKILQYIKRAEDSTAVPATAALHLLCDLGLAIAPEIVRLLDPHADLQRDFPGTIPLPSALFRPLQSSGRKAGGLSLPADWQPQVSLTFCTASRPGSKAAAAPVGGAKAEKVAKSGQSKGGKRSRKAKAPEADGAAEGSGRAKRRKPAPEDDGSDEDPSSSPEASSSAAGSEPENSAAQRSDPQPAAPQPRNSEKGPAEQLLAPAEEDEASGRPGLSGGDDRSQDAAAGESEAAAAGSLDSRPAAEASGRPAESRQHKSPADGHAEPDAGREHSMGDKSLSDGSPAEPEGSEQQQGVDLFAHASPVSATGESPPDILDSRGSPGAHQDAAADRQSPSSPRDSPDENMPANVPQPSKASIEQAKAAKVRKAERSALQSPAATRRPPDRSRAPQSRPAGAASTSPGDTLKSSKAAKAEGGQTSKPAAGKRPRSGKELPPEQPARVQPRRGAKA